MDITVTPKQRMFMDAREDEVLFGGAAGGGKSYVQILDNLVYAAQYPGIKQLILRRTFPELERSLIRTSLELYPPEFGEYNSSKHTWVFRNGSVTDFGYCDSDKDVQKYMSLEYDVIRFDECTHFTEYMYEYLGSRIRGANNFPKQRKSSTNPGGESHQFFKERFIDIAPPMTRYTTKTASGRERSRLFIPSLVTENTFLMESDPDYVARLEELPENEKQKLLYGNWDIYEGQYFPEFKRDIHVIKPFMIPEHWRVYFTMDYGLDMFAGYWIALDEQERGYVIREIHEPNVIISDAAKMIKQITREISETQIRYESEKRKNEWRVHRHLAPPDLWNRRQETGKSVKDIFYEHGISLYKTSNDRVDGWMAMKEWLKPFRDEQDILRGKLSIFNTCVNLIRCIPALRYSETKPNDVATQPHDITHAPDAIRGFCVYRSRPNRKHEEPTDDEIWNRYHDQYMANDDMFHVYGRKTEEMEDKINELCSDDSHSMLWY